MIFDSSFNATTMKYLLLLCTILHLSWAKPNTASTKLLIETINSKQSTWKAGINFPDETPAEFAKSRLGLLGNHPDPKFRPEIKVHKIGRTTIPESFDARDQWPVCKDVINNIRDQGNCGSCWAFASSEVMSDRLCIETKGETKFEFSPQHLISCCPYCGYGCDGGYAYSAWLYWTVRGVVSGGDYNTSRGCIPYNSLAFLNHTTTSCTTYCTNTNYETTYDNDLFEGVYYWTIESGNVTQIQAEIMTNGPVQASYVVYEDFSLYKEGVYQYVAGDKLGGHAVKIVGWGTENNVPYWLVANSWGSNWANLNGYFKIRRGTNECGIESSIVAGIATQDYPFTTPNPDSHGSAIKIISSGVGMLLGGLIFFFLFE